MTKREVACEHKNFSIIEKEETYPVLGEDTTILANVKVCDDCGEEVFDFQLDEDNLKRAFSKYKRKHALMTAMEIMALRRKYNISQRTLATLIGCSQATVVRYENGNIQNNTHNNIMRMLQKPENMEEILEVKEEELSSREIDNIKTALAKLNSLDAKSTEILGNFSEYLCIKPDRFSGFKEFDFNKFMMMVSYFAENIKGNLYKTKLFKLLWYADMYFFKEFTVSISGMNYVHFQYGPVPREYSFLLGLMEKLGAISIVETENSYGSGDVVIARDDYVHAGNLTSDELQILDKVIEKFGSMSAAQISDQSHKEKGYMKTANMDLISYTYAMDME